MIKLYYLLIMLYLFHYAIYPFKKILQMKRKIILLLFILPVLNSPCGV
jgi:hypothetical protein